MSKLRLERRFEKRQPPARPVQVVAVNRYQQPLLVLHDAQAVDVTTGGMAIRTSVPIARGATLAIQVGGSDRPEHEEMVLAEVLDRHRDTNGMHLLNCRVVRGPVPMRLISHRWQDVFEAWDQARSA